MSPREDTSVLVRRASLSQPIPTTFQMGVIFQNYTRGGNQGAR